MSHLKEKVVGIINEVAAQLDGLTHDPVAIAALATKLRETAAARAEAVCENEEPEEVPVTTKPQTRQSHPADPAHRHK
mgnify:CR=1 FL=1